MQWSYVKFTTTNYDNKVVGVYQLYPKKTTCICCKHLILVTVNPCFIVPRKLPTERKFNKLLQLWLKPRHEGETCMIPVMILHSFFCDASCDEVYVEYIITADHVSSLGHPVRTDVPTSSSYSQISCHCTIKYVAICTTVSFVFRRK